MSLRGGLLWPTLGYSAVSFLRLFSDLNWARDKGKPLTPKGEREGFHYHMGPKRDRAIKSLSSVLVALFG